MICIYQSKILCDVTGILVTHLGLEAVICHFSLSQHSSKSHCKTASWKATPLLLFFSSYFTFFLFCFFHPFISFSISVCYTPLYHLHPSPPSFPPPCPPLSSVVCNLWKQLDLVSRGLLPLSCGRFNLLLQKDLSS